MSIRIVCQSARHLHGDTTVTEFYRGHGGKWKERRAYSRAVLQEHDYPLGPDISERDVMRLRAAALRAARKPRAKALPHGSQAFRGAGFRYVFVCEQCGHNVPLQRKELVDRLMTLLDYAEGAGMSLVPLSVVAG